METLTNNSALLKAIDFELKTLLMQDLKRVKMIKESKQVVIKSAA